MIGDHVGPYVTQTRLLLEDISDGRNPVTERYGPDSEGGGLEYNGLLRPDDIEPQVEGQVASEEIHYLGQYPFSLLKGMYGEASPGPSQFEGGYKARQSEHMVSVKMCKKNVAEP